MTTDRQCRPSPAIWILIFIFLALGIWTFLNGLWVRIWTGHAAEQMQIFEEMRVKALTAESPAAAAAFLDYTVSYYPSGTKHTTGSRLDRMVEQARASAVREIIVELRKKTGEDLGDDPEAWIKKYGRK